MRQSPDNDGLVDAFVSHRGVRGVGDGEYMRGEFGRRSVAVRLEHIGCVYGQDLLLVMGRKEVNTY